MGRYTVQHRTAPLQYDRVPYMHLGLRYDGRGCLKHPIVRRDHIHTQLVSLVNGRVALCTKYACNISLGYLGGWPACRIVRLSRSMGMVGAVLKQG